MDAAMLWVTVVSALAAVAAAIFGFVQANEAMKSRNDANDARVKAEQAEIDAVAARDAAVLAQQESASAAGRIAEVLEEQAAAARAAAEQREQPWSIGPGRYRKNGDAVLLTLGGSHAVADVSIEFERAPRILHLDPDPVPSTMHPGEAIEIYYMRTAGDSSTSIVVVHWRWVDAEEMNTTRATLN